VAYVWTASVLKSISAPASALQDYQKALAIGQRLARIGPAVHGKMGDFFRKTGQPDRAAENYDESIARAGKLLSSNPGMPEPYYILAAPYFGLGELCSSVAGWQEARSLVSTQPGGVA
jgi:tetratricopeptide (TPR) repeat protein